MNRAIATGVLIVGVFFAFLIFFDGDKWPSATIGWIGVVVGIAAIVPFVEWYLHDERRRDSHDAAVALIREDSGDFARAIADVFADELERAHGEGLANAMLAASNLSAALTELVRRGVIKRHEELLRSRTWLP